MAVRRLILQALVLCTVAILPALAAGLWHPRQPVWTPVVAAEGEVLLATARSWGRDVLWVDARSPEEYLLDRIPGAMPLNFDQWKILLPDVVAAAGNKHVVVYCNEECETSEVVARRLKRETPLTNVYVLKGGFQAWTAAMR